MDKFKHVNFIVSKSEQLSILKIQGEVFPFTEKPSDKHGVSSEGLMSGETDGRINPFDLFSLFTADVISRKVVYVR